LLIVGEVALAFVLMVGTSLLALSLFRVLKVNPGFETRNLYTAEFALLGPKYAQNGPIAEASRQALARVRSIPGVQIAALVSTLPLSGESDRDGFIIQDRPMKDSDAPSIDSYWVTADYFRAMQIPLVRGRLFTDADEAICDKAPVAIISESTAKQMWPSADPLGKKIQLGGRSDKDPWATIVGIVPDVRQYGLDAEPTAEAYWLSLTRPSTFVVRSSLSDSSLTRAIGDSLAGLDKNIPVYHAATMEALIGRMLSQRRFVATLVGAFGTLALMLAGIGIYGVMAYHVCQRTGEIGIRMALGATPKSILGIVASDGARVAIAGSLLGAALAFAATRFMVSQLYHVKPTEPVAYIISAAAIAADLFLACYIPARRAAHVDPMVALRHE
jgi:predicted permease